MIEAWPDNVADAVALQKLLAAQVSLEDQFSGPHLIAGVDVSYDIAADTSKAVVALIAFESLQPVEVVTAFLPTAFPYVPGLLSFREIPVVLEALKKLTRQPDLLMVDGQGIAHPRRLGIAAHLGVMLDKPAIGVAKSRLTGRYAEPGPAKGDRSDLMDRGEKIGTVLRSKERCNPLFISSGHRVSHQTSIDLVVRGLTRYRLPEPTRIADKVSKQKESGLF